MRRKGFTLVELLVVIGIIALLISILLPSLAKARQAANKVACLSNQRQICLAVRMFANDHKDYLPGAGYNNGQGVGQYLATGTITDWRVQDPLNTSKPPQSSLVKLGYLPRDSSVFRCPQVNVLDLDGAFEATLGRHVTYMYGFHLGFFGNDYDRSSFEARGVRTPDKRRPKLSSAKPASETILITETQSWIDFCNPTPNLAPNAVQPFALVCNPSHDGGRSASSAFADGHAEITPAYRNANGWYVPTYDCPGAWDDTQ